MATTRNRGELGGATKNVFSALAVFKVDLWQDLDQGLEVGLGCLAREVHKDGSPFISILA